MEQATAGGTMMEAAVGLTSGTTDRNKMKVMVALDDSDPSFYALSWTLSTLLKVKTTATMTTVEGDISARHPPEEGCLFYLLHVQQPFHNYVFPAGPTLHTAPFASSSVVEAVRQAQTEISANILERALSICKRSMVRAETLILQGDPKEAICQQVEQMHVDLLVVGSRGLGQIKRAFLGSVSDYCAHHACSALLIVKLPKGTTHDK